MWSHIRWQAHRPCRFRLNAVVVLAALLASSVHAAAEENGERKSETSPAATMPALDSELFRVPLDPTWPKQLYVISDSVLLDAKPNLTKSLPGWQVTFAGRPALMIHKAVDEIRQQKDPLGSVAVVALGNNSLWERDRKNFKIWSDRFDKEVEDMLAVLRERGVHKVVWVLVRELPPEASLARETRLSEYRLVGWYFPYVNERLRAIKTRHPELALADWATAAARPDVTYDGVHLNRRGAELMAGVVKVAIGVDGPGQEQAPSQEGRMAPSPATSPVPSLAVLPEAKKLGPDLASVDTSDESRHSHLEQFPRQEERKGVTQVISPGLGEEVPPVAEALMGPSE